MSLPTFYNSSNFTIPIPLEEFVIQCEDEKYETIELETIPTTSFFIEETQSEADIVMPDVEEVQEVVEITRNHQGELECPVCSANFKIVVSSQFAWK